MGKMHVTVVACGQERVKQPGLLIIIASNGLCYNLSEMYQISIKYVGMVTRLD